MNTKNILIISLTILCILFMGVSYTFYKTNYDENIYRYGIIDSTKKLFTRSKKINLKREEINIIINKEDLDSLSLIREKCIQAGYIGNDIANPYFKAIIVYNKDSLNGKVRLKGDFLDHISDPKKWSLKIKLKGKNKLFGMKEFAIQRPGVRNGYGEYVYHKILKNLGLPYLYYDFVPVKVNDVFYGIYAVEGRFNKDFYKINNIKKQPILRFNDSRFFNKKRKILGRATNNVLWNDWSSYSAKIDCYDIDKILSDSVLKKNLEIGASKLELFRTGELNSKEVFDLEKLATFYAVCDLFGSYHASQFPNVRYYFNDETKLLDPIGFDANGLSNVDILFAQELSYYGSENYGGRRFEHRLNWLLIDIDFLKIYHAKLLQISNEEYLDSIIDMSKSEFEKNKEIEKIIGFSWESIRVNQKTILSKLDPIDVIQVNVVENNSQTILNFINANHIAIEIIDIVNKNGRIIGTPKNTPYVFGRDKNQHSIHQQFKFNVTTKIENPSFIRYKIIGLNKIYKQKIDFWNNSLTVDQLQKINIK